ncbi:NADH dehydrogenase subunit J [Nitrospira sp.]|nr:NADH dehydrogenase subunit J [Nitrospira sp.]
MSYLVFFYLATVIAVTAVLVVLLRNPIYSALSLLVLFFHVAGLYVTLHAEFLAAVQILVYAGAILVLYLFVVMLLNLKAEDRYHNQLPVAAFLGLMALTEVILLVLHRGSPVASTEEFAVSSTGNTESIGEVLYSQYLFPFEIASLVLLVAMIGAIILAKKDLLTGPSDKDHRETAST